MKLFRIRGGVHPEERKGATAERPIETPPLAPRLYIPLQQHIGAPAEPAVQAGERVLKGQLLGSSQGVISAPVHAPTSGRIVSIGDYPAPHPSGLPVRTIVLEPDGEECWIELQGCDAPLELPRGQIAERVAAAGIVGMGGATFPSAVKLDLPKRYALHTLVINGAECEPYLTCDDRLMRERPHDMLEGVRIIARALGVEHVLIAVEDNKPRALKTLTQAARGMAGISVVAVPTRYPTGSEKHLIEMLTGRETPAAGLTAEIGVVVHNVATCVAVHEAIRYGHPLIERVVTVAGGAVAEPKNLRVPIGTPVQHLIDHCGGLTEAPARLLSGGPMMGQVLPHTDVAVVKGSSGILALTAAETRTRQPSACIRCASCVGACPCGLVPLEMAAHIRSGDLDGAAEYGLQDCIACGSCAYVCPAHIPLVHYFNHAKGTLTARRRAQLKQDETRELAALRAERLERQAQAKREAMAKRKAEMAAKKAAAAAAEAGG